MEEKKQVQQNDLEKVAGGLDTVFYGDVAICPVCGKRFIKHEDKQIYDSKSCANKARRDNGIGYRR